MTDSVDYSVAWMRHKRNERRFVYVLLLGIGYNGKGAIQRQRTKEAEMRGGSRNVVAALVAPALLWSAVLVQSAVAGDSKAIEKAKALFKRYVDLEHAYDVAAADLYSDDAVIKNKRTYPTGQVRELSMPAPKYKELIRQAMPLAKARGDRSTYSDCKYAEVGERVRITCNRYSELKKYTSPLTLLVGPDARAEWRIFEELSESQP